MNYLLVFGSLRKNSDRGFNHNRFGGQTYIKDVILDGFEMYSLGPYPAICKGQGKIKCELHSVTDPAFECILEMESGAGYDRLDLPVEDKIATIFVMNSKILKSARLQRVQDGDWK